MWSKCPLFYYWSTEKRKVVGMTALFVTGDVEACLQRLSDDQGSHPDGLPFSVHFTEFKLAIEVPKETRN